MSLGYFRGYVLIYEFVSARFENDIASRQCLKKVRRGSVCVTLSTCWALASSFYFLLLTLMLYVFEKEKSTISKFVVMDFHLKLKKVFSI